MVDIVDRLILLPLVLCATYTILPNRRYSRSEKDIASRGTLRRHPHHIYHRVDLQCHRLHHGCSPLEAEGEGEVEGVLSTEFMLEIVGQVME